MPTTERFRHRPVPEREFGDRLIVARPGDGGPVVMAPTAALVWRLLDDWIGPGEIDRRLAEAFPEVADADRTRARAEILDMLEDDGFVERG